MILILLISRIFDNIYACTLVCELELAFAYLFCHRFLKNRMFQWFFSQKSIFAYSLCILFSIMFKLLRSLLHYDVIVTSYGNGWYLFWYQWKTERIIVIHFIQIGYRTFIIENPCGVATPSPFRGRVTENASGGRRLITGVLCILKM